MAMLFPSVLPLVSLSTLSLSNYSYLLISLPLSPPLHLSLTLHSLSSLITSFTPLLLTLSSHNTSRCYITPLPLSSLMSPRLEILLIMPLLHRLLLLFSSLFSLISLGYLPKSFSLSTPYSPYRL